MVERYQQRIAPLIERGTHALGPEGAARLIEEPRAIISSISASTASWSVAWPVARFTRSTSYSACSKRSALARGVISGTYLDRKE